MALEYLREYRTYFHIGKSYGLSEPNAYKGIKWVEDSLAKGGAFSLPGRKALAKGAAEHEAVLMDATETLCAIGSTADVRCEQQVVNLHGYHPSR